MRIRFLWDARKARANLAKHGVSFERARLVFDDPRALSLADDTEAEERWRTLGLVNGVVVLLVVHTVEGEGDEKILRIISARKATRLEREEYERAGRSD